MSDGALRIGLYFFAAVNLLTGALQLLTPGWFFDNIGPYGAENHHYIGDVGAFYVAAGVALLIAVRRPGWREPLLVLAALWYGLHALNHLFDIGESNEGDSRGISDTVLLAIGAAALAYMARAAGRRGGEGRPPEHQIPAPTGRRPDYPPGD